ncbi:hypothetical protein D3C78_882970 [compost metagenome]
MAGLVGGCPRCFPCRRSRTDSQGSSRCRRRCGWRRCGRPAPASRWPCEPAPGWLAPHLLLPRARRHHHWRQPALRTASVPPPPCLASAPWPCRAAARWPGSACRQRSRHRAGPGRQPPACRCAGRTGCCGSRSRPAHLPQGGCLPRTRRAPATWPTCPGRSAGRSGSGRWRRRRCGCGCRNRRWRSRRCSPSPGRCPGHRCSRNCRHWG